MPEPQVSVTLPAYNEGASLLDDIKNIRSSLERAGIPYEFIVIDDGSTDDTGEIARKAGVQVIRHDRNRGVGAARKTGILAAKTDFIITSDADGTYPAGPIPEMIRIAQDCDMVIGARKGEKGTLSLLRKPAKFFIRKLASYLAGTPIPDLNSGLRVIRKSAALKYFYLLPNSHSWESTITLAFLCNSQRVRYLPIDYFKRSGGVSSFHPVKDTYNYFSLMIRTIMYFNPLRIFLPVSILIFLVGAVKSTMDFIRFHSIGGMDVLVLLTSLLILIAGLLADLLVVLLRKLDPFPGYSTPHIPK
ncbi:MAG: hypothetical protein A2636_06255 [Elusimicrobia bacterium RIFCSPHIGHO2_01_FULL_64_10]|nr:MAG: hypothetical protein A2636_06255 [Elusimicrobia bacterium RIFCSPHIGHO2_01_FULL_64_10]